jgi:hypothetical protein
MRGVTRRLQLLPADQIAARRTIAAVKLLMPCLEMKHQMLPLSGVLLQQQGRPLHIYQIILGACLIN